MEEEESRSSIERLPEGCISTILSFTSPADVCRAAAVSTTFRSAASSDVVWIRFLPPDLSSALADVHIPPHVTSKKQLYFYLCECDHPVLINDGAMSYQLDRSTGAKCYMLSARSLTIIWGDTSQYWRWIHLPDSRFGEAAELLAVCWLEIRGKIESRLLTEKTTYVAYLIFRLDEGSYMFHNPPQETCVKVGDQKSELTVRLQPNQPNRAQGRDFRILQSSVIEQEEEPGIKTPKLRDDQWMEVELGKFYNDTGEDGEVDMSFMEVRGGHWKRGLIVQGMEIRPKKSS